MIYDGASCHNQDQDSLKMPKNMATKKLPPYSPELNPTEPIWDRLERNFFPILFLKAWMRFSRHSLKLRYILKTTLKSFNLLQGSNG